RRRCPRGRPPPRAAPCHVAENGQGWMPRGATFSEPPRVRLARPNLKFNHRLHVARGMGCELCHANVAQEAIAARDYVPRMSLCLGCHNGKSDTKADSKLGGVKPEGNKPEGN